MTLYYSDGRSEKFGGNGGNLKTLHFGSACLIGFHGRSGSLVDSIGFITAELLNASKVSMKNTYGYWEPIMTHVSVHKVIKVSTTLTDGSSLSSEQASSFSASTNVETTATVGGEFVGGSVSATIGFEFTTDQSFSTGKTSSNSVSHGKEVTDTIVCNTKDMGQNPSSGVWTAW